MAIRHKRKNTAAYTWQAADLVEGQIGLNIADGTLHFKKSNNAIVNFDSGAATIVESSTAPVNTTNLWLDTSDPNGAGIIVPENVVIVKNATDLPAASAGVIQLTDNTLYQFNGTVALSATLNLGTNTMITGLHLGNDVLYYTGTGAAITGTNKNSFMEKLIIVAPSGSAFNLTGTTTTEFLWQLVGVASTPTVGTVSGFRVPTFLNCNFEGFTNGITLTGTSQKVYFDGCPFRTFTGTGLNFDANFETDVVDLSGAYWKTATTTATAININAGAIINNFALMRGCSFVGMTTALVGFGPETPIWDFKNNTPTRDSANIGQIYMSGNATATTLTVNTWTKVAGTTTTGLLERFSHPLNNRITYTGLRPDLHSLVIGSLSVQGTANNQQVEFAIYKNGVIENPVMTTNLTGAARPDAVTLNAIIDITTNDYIEVYCRCTSGSNNITVTSMQLSIQA